MEIPVGCDLPVSAWSVLASPEWLEVGSTDMEENDSEQVPGFRRFAGFPLEAGETVTMRLNSGEQVAGPEEELFTKDAPAEQEEAGGRERRMTRAAACTLPLIFVGVLIIVIIVAAVRRRS